MSDSEKDLTFEEAKKLCQMAFDAGADYASTCKQFGCNAVAYDWEHWLKRNEHLFMPAPTVEDVLMELLADWAEQDEQGERTTGLVSEYAKRLRLAGDGE